MSKEEVINRLALAFQEASKEFYLVGGTVRDTILGRVSHDIDCATNALPEQIKQIVTRTQPLHIVPIGEKFGTIQVHYEQEIIIEVTTYRGERYQPGSRKPEVQFGTSLHEDLRRRDFTINAIAMDPLTGYYVDPFYGRKDLYIGIIRAVDDPVQRFKDDPLRLLRAVRLATQLGFIISMITKMAIGEQVESLRHISQERIRDELCKLLLLDDVARGIRLMDERWMDETVLDHILPEVSALIGVSQPPHHKLDVFNHTLTVVSLVPARIEVRLAALLHDIAKPVTKTMQDGIAHFYEHEDVGAEMARSILQRLRFGNESIERVVKIVKLHMRVNQYSSKWSNGSVRRLFVDAGEVIDDLLDLALADGASDSNEPREAIEARLNELRTRLAFVQSQVAEQPIQSPLDGRELMEIFGRGPGAWLKPLKAYLHDLVVEGTLQSDDKDAAIAYARVFVVQREKICSLFGHKDVTWGTGYIK